MLFLPLLFIAYLLGCINPAIEISTRFYKRDIRGFGSGNAGSTNMFRTFGLGAGIVTQVLDIAKGSIAALLPYLFLYFFPEQRHWFSEMEVPFQCTLTGLAAVIGHIWPLLYGFKGGKGINSLLGAMLVVDPLACLACALVFILVLLITRYVSLGSILGTATFPLFTYFFNPVVKPSYLLSGVVMFLLILFTHRENMKRLLSGTENKFGSKKK